ncbi:unnamed protein product [Triticum turgidum subsp. durum]|uniref:Uncharacterized protein n=1 Tax=Triticum turgidum subsp. durum TaxID=4567 RepID=A0A9R0XW80_TRITD|nr:unnamed protein product [Triticum turgidum subsp. durum]
MLNAERKFSLFNASGIAPMRLLLEKSSTCRFVRLHTDIGICPVRALKLKLRETRDFSWPISEGISPVNLLLLRSSTLAKAMGMRY